MLEAPTISARIINGYAAESLRTLPDASVDAVITDPPYPCVKRSYGYWTEAEWWEMMMEVIVEVRRALKPKGSAVFILQPNSEKVGRMRGWLWRFMAWVCEEWNMVQDVWWWNFTSPPTVHCHRDRGLMRPSVKGCVWVGATDCYRNQDSVLWKPSEANGAIDRSNRALTYKTSGLSMRAGRCAAAADERGGVTPFNLLPISNADSCLSGGAVDHDAATPYDLCAWWVRYIAPEGGLVVDPFCGSGTVGMAAINLGCSFIGIEKEADYCRIAEKRIGNCTPSLFQGQEVGAAD